MKIENKIILIFGGTGSLGYELNSRYKETNVIYNFSRDECKHWEMKIHFNNNKNIHFIIGNVADKNIVSRTITRIKPNIIIIACAMKHIDQCETNTYESINTNLLGTQNVLESIENNKNELLLFLETVLFVSSDKACSPINNYGLCKALSETLIVEKAYYIPEIKFVNIRYGNVLNSRGSIIPLLHKIGVDKEKEYFTLTHENMTRFVMTLSQSVDLVEYGILYGETGDTIIPQLISMNVKDMIEIFSEKYKKPIKITGLRSGEKLLESLINKTQSGRLQTKNNYMHIKSVLLFPNILNKEIKDYNSTLNPLSKEELKIFLEELKLL